MAFLRVVDDRDAALGIVAGLVQKPWQVA